jgi:hypothetical protein
MVVLGNADILLVRGAARKFQIPSTKSQGNSKFKVQKSKRRTGITGVFQGETGSSTSPRLWILNFGLGISLVFDSWNLVFRPPLLAVGTIESTPPGATP